jgi:hypothetical protein
VKLYTCLDAIRLSATGLMIAVDRELPDGTQVACMMSSGTTVMASLTKQSAGSGVVTYGATLPSSVTDMSPIGCTIVTSDAAPLSGMFTPNLTVPAADGSTITGDGFGAKFAVANPLPSGGTAGQVLGNSGGAPEWINAATTGLTWHSSTATTLAALLNEGAQHKAAKARLIFSNQVNPQMQRVTISDSTGAVSVDTVSDQPFAAGETFDALPLTFNTNSVSYWVMQPDAQGILWALRVTGEAAYGDPMGSRQGATGTAVLYATPPNNVNDLGASTITSGQLLY